jgi:hypothetical protein
LAVGPLMYKAVELTSHAAVKEHLTARLRADLPPYTEEVIDGLGLAAKLGLPLDSPHRTALLRTWTNQSPVAMPPPWKAQLTRYLAWNSVLETPLEEAV